MDQVLYTESVMPRGLPSGHGLNDVVNLLERKPYLYIGVTTISREHPIHLFRNLLYSLEGSSEQISDVDRFTKAINRRGDTCFGIQFIGVLLKFCKVFGLVVSS